MNELELNEAILEMVEWLDQSIKESNEKMEAAYDRIQKATGIDWAAPAVSLTPEEAAEFRAKLFRKEEA